MGTIRVSSFCLKMIIVTFKIGMKPGGFVSDCHVPYVRTVLLVFAGLSQRGQNGSSSIKAELDG